MNLLIYSDIHICVSDIEECNSIFNEIIELCNQHNIDDIISLGDNFDNYKPSALELNCLGNFIKQLKNKKIILLSAQSHESETLELSSVDIYGILSDNVQVVKEYQDENYLYCGHFIVKEAKKNFGATKSKNELKYRYVFLGHQHQHEIIKPNICQLGSCRFINFDEAEDNQKIVTIIEDYKGEKERVLFIALKSPIPMISLELNKSEVFEAQNEAQNPKESKIAPINPLNPRQNKALSDLLTKLDQLPAKTKVRIVFKDYQNWVNFLPYYERYKNKFIKFSDKKDFIMSSNLDVAKKENITLKESLIKWMELKKIDEKIKQILLEEIK
jgi:DNA repair exonuclease SbcCD nuclease subunit